MLRVNVTCSYNIVVEEHELEDDARHSESGNPYSDSYWEGSQESDVPEDEFGEEEEEEEEHEDWDNQSDAESVQTEDESQHDGDSAESDYDNSMSIVPYGTDPRRTRRDVHRRIHRSYRWRHSVGSADAGAESSFAAAAPSSQAAGDSEAGDGHARGTASMANAPRRASRRAPPAASTSNCIQGEVVLGQPTVMYRTQPSQLSGPAAAAASAAAAAVAAASGPSQRVVVQAAARAAAAAAANSVAEQMELHNTQPWPTSSAPSAPVRPERSDQPRRSSHTSRGSSAGDEWPMRGTSREDAEMHPPYSTLYPQQQQPHRQQRHLHPPSYEMEEEDEGYDGEEESLLSGLGRPTHSRLLPNTSSASAAEALSAALADYPRYDYMYGHGGGRAGARYGGSSLRGQYLAAERDWDSAYLPRSRLAGDGGDGGKYGSATDALEVASEEAISARLRLAEAMRQQMTLPEDIVQAGSAAATTAVAAGGMKCLFARRSHERIALPPSRPVSAVSDRRHSTYGHHKGGTVEGRQNVGLLSAVGGEAGAQVPLDTPDMLEMRDGAEVLVVLDPAEPLTPEADGEAPLPGPSPTRPHSPAAAFAPRAGIARKVDAPVAGAGKQLASQRSRIEPKRGGATTLCDSRRSGGSLSNVLRVEQRGREGVAGVGGRAEALSAVPAAINPRLRRSQPLAPTHQPLSNHHRRLGLSISGHRSGGPPAAAAGGGVSLPLLRQ